jgi:hypothetical protein
MLMFSESQISASVRPLRSNQCRYPIGKGASSVYCCDEALEGAIYCAQHGKLAHYAAARLQLDALVRKSAAIPLVRDVSGLYLVASSRREPCNKKPGHKPGQVGEE